jgi:hypothetical protein
VKFNLSLGFTQAGIGFYESHVFAPGIVRTGQKVFSGMGAFSGDAFDQGSAADGAETKSGIFTHTVIFDDFRELGCVMTSPFQENRTRYLDPDVIEAVAF